MKLLALFVFSCGLLAQEPRTSAVDASTTPITEASDVRAFDLERGAGSAMEPSSFSAAPRGARQYRLSVAAFAAASVADTWSSWGGRELNPVLGTGRFTTKQASIKGAITAGMIAAEIGLVRRHPSLRRTFTVTNWIAAGLLAGVAARNERLR